MQAMARWARADLRSHRGAALFLVLATVGIVIALLLATALFTYATNPWQRVFTETRGAHVWLHTSVSADTGRLAGLDGVDSVAGPYPTESVALTAHGARASAELRGTSTAPSVGRPRVTAGRWLRESDTDGVVLETRLARALLAGPGDTLALPGTARTLTVLGVAESAEPRYRPGARPGLVWAPPAAVRAPDGQVTGLRLSDPDGTDYAVQRAVTVLGAGAVGEVSTWQQARAQAQGDNRLLGQVLGLFGLAALLAACLAVYGAIAARVRGHLRNIAVLKAIGFTPGQVVGVFVFQHLAHALTGAAVAAVLVQTLGSRVPGRVGDAIGIWQGLPHHTTALAAVPAGTVLFIGVTTALAAWRAGLVPPVPEPRRPGPTTAGLSPLAREALGRRLPPALVLGVHRVVARRSRSLATVARLALPLLLIVVAMSAWSTIDRLREHPEQAGLAAALTVRADGLGEAETRSLLRRDPRIAAVYPGVEVSALVPGQNATIALRGLGTGPDPYPYALAEGRAPHGPSEAVAGQGLLDLLHVRVGDWVRMTVGAHPHVLHLVGRAIEPENAGRVVSTSLDNLRAGDPELGATLYQLRLRPGADAGAVAAAVAARGGGHLDVHAVADPTDGLSPLRSVIAGLIAVLAFIGLVELLTSIGAAVREGEGDLLALKAIGLTPRQITAITVTATACTALAAVALGLAAGLPLAGRLIDAHGRSTGIGAGIAHLPPAGRLLAFALTAVAGAAVLAVLPAARAAHRHRADAVR
ncbi:FtsX-like permease family protein [Streptomyces ziwulingensis]|uniref:ABC3 transporter permease C-terminal domain-containing protein n=1 Tax=Streptomyces ziwulingensis TaxID=1045501 RepID=A0ABP9CUI5_9ACTN